MNRVKGSKETMAAVYDRLAESKTPAFQSTSEILAKPIEEFFDSLPSGASLLDVGPGKGLEAKLALSRGLKVTGLDISPSMLEVFKSNAPSAKAVIGSMSSMPMASESFDAILSSSSLLHLDRGTAVKAMKEFKRVLVPGGKLCLGTTVTPYGKQGYEEINERPWLQEVGIDGWYFYHWEPEDLIRQVIAVGFEIDKTSSHTLVDGRPDWLFITASRL